MPSLEIVCIGQTAPTDLSSLPFRVQTESCLISHRAAQSLFRADFDKLTGYIYHFLDAESVTAYDLLKRNWYDEKGMTTSAETNVEFRDEYAHSVKIALGELLASSPTGQILFTTDYQFGPKDARRYGPISFAHFWELHNHGQIRMNSAYLITNQPF